MPVRERGPVRIGALLPAVLANYGIMAEACDKPSAAVLQAIAWAAADKIAGKEFRREQLGECSHRVDLSIVAMIDDKHEFAGAFTALLTIGADTTRSTSSACDLNQLVGFLLSKFNESTREKLLRDLPSEFAKRGNALPDVEPAIVETAKQLLSKLRCQTQSTAKGAVAVKYLPREATPDGWPATKP